MTARLLTLIEHDARQQLRFGVYYAYAFVIVFYIVVLTYASPYLPAWMVGFIVFTDPAAVGFFFLGGLMMLERAEMSRTALAITPTSAADYFFAKAATLTLVGLVAAGIIAAVAHQGVRWGIYVLAVALTSITYIGIGVPIALRFKTVTNYLIGSSAFLTPLILPCFLALLDPMPVWAMILPPAAQLKLIFLGLGDGDASLIEFVILWLSLAAGAAGGVWLGVRALAQEFGRR